MALYTRLTDSRIKEILSDYNLGEMVSISPLEGGQANSSFRIDTHKERFILSVCDEKNSREIDTLTRVLEYLNSKDFPTSPLIRTMSGHRFLTHDKKPVYVKKFIPGRVIQNLKPDMVFDVGKAMAVLHRLQKIPGLPDRFPYGLDAFDRVLVQDLGHPFIKWLKKQKDYLIMAMDPSMKKRFIHGDIFWDNLVFSNDGGLRAILDFEEACNYYTLFDLGMCAVGCCSHHGEFDLSMVARLLKGYTQEIDLCEKEKSQFKVFLVYAATAAAFWRFRQYNLVFPDPEKQDFYQELSCLADQARDMREDRFLRIFN